MKIAIAGVGGIGSNVAVNLIRSGIDELIIVDFDKIENSNLNRQFYFYDQIGMKKVDALEENLKRINPKINIIKNHIKLNENNINNILGEADIIVEGFDVAEYKKIIIETFASTGKLMVSASGIAGYDTDKINIRKIGNCYIVGDFTSDFHKHKLFAHKVQVVASIMSGILLEKGNLL